MSKLSASKLISFAATERQAEICQAVINHGSNNKAAKALDGSKLGGRTLRVNMAHGKRKAEESAQPDAEVGGLAVDGMYGGDAGPLGAWVEMTDATSGKRTGLPSLFPGHVDLAPADTHTWLSLPPSFPSLPAAPPSLALIFA